MNYPYEIITTTDGSRTLRDLHFKVPFHSVHGAVTEGLHVFIAAGLAEAASTHTQIRILEVGFGTGLNALLACLHSQEHELDVDYTGIDPTPLPIDLVRELGYPEYLGQPQLAGILEMMHLAVEPATVSDRFVFKLIREGLQTLIPEPSYNLVFYDAFAPGAQPEMWTRETLGYLSRLLLPGAILVTYCAKGQFKRDLRSLGFKVESLPGPPGKREMVRASWHSAPGPM